MERRKESPETKNTQRSAEPPQALLRSPLYFLLSRLEAAPMPFAFEKLRVYQKAITFADQLCPPFLIQRKIRPRLARSNPPMPMINSVAVAGSGTTVWL